MKLLERNQGNHYTFTIIVITTDDTFIIGFRVLLRKKLFLFLLAAFQGQFPRQSYIGRVSSLEWYYYHTVPPSLLLPPLMFLYNLELFNIMSTILCCHLCTMLYNVTGYIYIWMLPLNSWWNSIPFLWKTKLCESNIDNLRSIIS